MSVGKNEKTIESYLDGLIAKAKKSWAGVDVDSYMNNLRDIDAVTIRCRDLMVGDWVAIPHGFAMQITDLGEDYAYANWDDNEGDPWEFCDKEGFEPAPIEITNGLLKANGWEQHSYTQSNGIIAYYCTKDDNGVELQWLQGLLTIYFDYEDYGLHSEIYMKCNHIHQLQQALRFAGMTEMANNFKI